MAKDKEPRARKFELTVQVVRLGSGYFAIAQLAGMNVQSNRAAEAADAVRDLFQQLSLTHHVNAGLAIDLALEGETWEGIRDTLPSLES